MFSVTPATNEFVDGGIPYGQRGYQILAEMVTSADQDLDTEKLFGRFPELYRP